MLIAASGGVETYPLPPEPELEPVLDPESIDRRPSKVLLGSKTFALPCEVGTPMGAARGLTANLSSCSICCRFKRSNPSTARGVENCPKPVLELLRIFLASLSESLMVDGLKDDSKSNKSPVGEILENWAEGSKAPIFENCAEGSTGAN